MVKKRARRIVEDDEPMYTGWANVIALDPGGTTGWSVMMVHPDALVDPDISVLSNIEHWTHGQFTGNEDDQAKQIIDLVEAWPDSALVMEQFKVRQMAVDLSPVRIIAKVEFGLKWMLDEDTIKPTRFMQMPALAKSTVTDARLREWGLYERAGGMEHARDADRHALTFLRRAKERAQLRQQAWPYLYSKDGTA
jgi:hypothetical protein